MLWRELVRIFTCGPSKRPNNSNTTYDRTNSHPSTTNLQESVTSVNKSNTYATRSLPNGRQTLPGQASGSSIYGDSSAFKVAREPWTD